MSHNVCILLSVLQVNILIKQMFDSAVFIIYWLSFKHLFTYMHILDCDDVFFTRWKKLWAELNDWVSLMLWLCFCMITMSKSWTSLLIKNDFWIFNDFLILYCSIHRKDCFVIKLFVTVVDSAKRRLFECFQSSWVYLVFWFVISDSAWTTSHLSRYSRKRNNQHVSSWLLSFVMLIHERLDCMFSA